MSEEIITTLSNLGAIDENKAVTKELLVNSDSLKNRVLDDDIGKLVLSGYVKKTDGKLYLTKAGLFRALSRFS
ncbi:MAG: hypothetical protein PXY39_09315 [archaeon]|nr:hypothetical protein [archaeon]